MQQIQSRNMIVRVQTVDGRIFLDGWTLNALGKRSMVQGSNDQIYELTMDELKEIITAYRRRNPELSVTAETQHINSLENLYSKSLNDMSEEEKFAFYIKNGMSESEAMEMIAASQVIDSWGVEIPETDGMTL